MGRWSLGPWLVALVAGCAARLEGGQRPNTAGDVGDTAPGGGDTYPSGVRFDARYGDQALRCGSEIPDVGTTAARVRVQDLRFYVSDLVLGGPAGSAPVQLDQDGRWQVGELALVDFEDNCSGAGTADLHTTVTGGIPEGDWTTLSFTLGVPPARNHVDGLSSTPPLDDRSLYADPTDGYKFLQAGLRVVNSTIETWPVVLRSAGCETDATATPPITTCARVNRPRYTLPFDPFADDVVVLDLERMLANATLSENAATSPPGCQCDGADTVDCGPVLAAFGLTPQGGCRQEDCGTQTVFSVRADASDTDTQ